MSVSKNQARNTGTTTWFVRHSSTSRIQTFTFGIPGDALVRFLQPDGRWYPAVVWVQDANKPLVWDVAGPGGHIVFNFGLPGDIIPNQRMQFGGSTNPTVVRARTDGTLQWFVLDWRNGAVYSTIFGVVGDQVGIAPDGTFLAIRNNFTWYGKTLFGTTLSFIRQWGLPGDIPLVPANNNQLVVVRQGAPNTLAYVLNPDGSNFTQRMGPNGSIPNIGHFFNSTGLDFAWHERALGRVTAFNSQNGGAVVFGLGNANMAIVTPPGQVFQASQGGQFGGGNPGNPNDPPSGGLQARCPSIRNPSGGEIWKNIASTHIPTSDPRRFSTSFITRSGTAAPQVSCIEAFDKNGNKVHSLGFYGAGGQYSSRFYGGSGCGDKKSGSAIASIARGNTGSPEIYLKTNSNTCIRIGNPNSCINSSAC